MSVRVLDSVVSGPLSVVLPDFVKELARRGYSLGSAGNHAGFLADLRWLIVQKLPQNCSQLTQPISRDLPDQGVVDDCVAVCQDISESNDPR